MRRHPVRHDRAGGDDRALAHGDAGKDGDARSDPRAILDGDGALLREPGAAPRRADVVIYGEEQAVVPDVDGVTDTHRPPEVHAQGARDVGFITDREELRPVAGP